MLQPTAWRQQFNGPAAIVVALKESLFFQVADVFVHCGQRAQLQAPADFLEGRRVLMLLHKVVDEFIDLSLFARE